MLAGLTSGLLLAFSGAVMAQEFDQQTKWNGFDQFHFTVEGRTAYFVAPEKAAPGRPWVWRARFPNYHAEMDVELLRRGMHVGYVDIAGLFGSPKAIEIGNAFYQRMTEAYGMHERPALEGVSRGGLFVYNWAAANSDKVACIYCDTPVLDIRSWPGGVGEGIGAAREWEQCLDAFGLSPDQADSFTGNPLDHADVISHAGIPLLHIVSENDAIVPPKENTHVLQQRLAGYGHPIQVISLAEGTEESSGHHFVHPDPAGVADFIAANAAVETANPVELLNDSKRILFLGDSISYAGGYIVQFETWLELSHPDEDRIVINGGLPSETVSGLSEEGHAGGRFPRPDLADRLERILDATDPDLVIACYGINCGIYQPIDAQRFEAYRNGIANLRTQVQARGAKLVHVTPPTFDDHQNTKGFDYDAVMQRYSEWLMAQRLAGWMVIDLHSTMARELLQRRLEDPEFTFQPDSVHPNDAGHKFIASQLIDRFSGGQSAGLAWPETMPGDVRIELDKLMRQRMTVRRDAWLTAAGHERPGIAAGMPVDEAEQQASLLSTDIRNLMDSGNILRPPHARVDNYR